MRRQLIRALVITLSLAGMASTAPPDRACARARPAAEWTVDDVVLSESAESFRISPDCHWVIWVKKGPDLDKNQAVGNLYLSSLTDEKEVQLTRGAESCLDPRWSPDGKRIAFLTARSLPKARDAAAEEEAATQLWLMNPFGGEPWAITSRPKGIVSYAWAGPDAIVFSAREEKKEEENDQPKDTTIVVEDESASPAVRLYQLALSTKKVKQLTKNTDRITTFAVSPDGRSAITFHERSPRYEFDGKIRPVYFLYDLTTGKRSPIFEDEKFSLNKAQWTPEGKAFYVSSSFTNDPRHVQATVEEL